MRGTQAWLGALLTAALAAAGLCGCQSPSGAARDRPGGGTPSPAASGFGAEFLAVGECSSFGTTSFTEVSCTSERAAARVVARFDGGPPDGGPACPATTDFVLHISASGAVPRGYACMRNLEPPHPGDPGGGGGPRTIVGDCVYGAGKGEVRETACDGKGGHAPEYRVTSAVSRRSQCPPSTALYVQLGGGKPVGCARTV
ncbi:hypothetical protein [Streptomyces sp. NPDC052036]|uniref:hypothetical protein n=1 Tax=unclassified Streptomyces TaxID=2593676 RepID=UPI0034318C27